MKLTRQNMDNLFTALNAALNKGLSQEWTGYKDWTMPVNSTGAGEAYPMALILGSMREWIGPRIINKVAPAKLDVINRDFEHLEAVLRNDIEDDNIGFYEPLFEAMGVDAANLWGRLATEALVSGPKWADGANFFGSRTLSKKSTINNTVAGALSMSTYETARSQMMGFTGADGTALGLVPDLLIVGPSNEATAKGILEADLTATESGTVSNVHRGESRVQVNPYLVGAHAGKWFLACTTRGVKPVAVQIRKRPVLVRYDQEHDQCVKDLNENHYGLHARGNAAAVQPALIIGGNLS